RRRASLSTSRRSTTASAGTPPWATCPRSSSSGRITKNTLNLDSIFPGEAQTTRRNEEDEDKRTQVERYKAPIRSDELGKGPWHDRHRQKHQNRNADHGHQVPLHADSPAHIAAQQAKHSGLSRGDS